ncbi:MAG: hypothetical protein R3B65_01510 [Candidatus Paceibacterota bacterium]
MNSKNHYSEDYTLRQLFSNTTEAKDASVGIKSGEKLTKSKSETIWFFTAPTVFGLIIELAIIFILIFIFAIWRLNKKKKKWIKKWVSYSVKEGDTIEKISRENKIHCRNF